LNALLIEQSSVVLIDVTMPGTDEFEPIEIEYDNDAALQSFALATAWWERCKNGAHGCITEIAGDYELENDPSVIPDFIAHLQGQMLRLKFCDEKGANRIAVALEEALLNGLYHGNLELSSTLREDGSDTFKFMAEQRRSLRPFCERRLRVEVFITSREALFVVRDEGPGFDPAALPDPTDPENLGKASGRGLLLIRAYMDEVFHNSKGNQITMIKRN